jgi:hypothetical protein
MARMVILYFENNACADSVVAASQGGAISIENADVPGEVVGTYAIPTKFCTRKEVNGCKGSRIALGEKFGWRLCRTCGLAIADYQISKNLVPEEKRSSFFHNALISFSTFSYKGRNHTLTVREGSRL